MNALLLVLATLSQVHPVTHGTERAYVVCSESSGQRCRGYIVDDGDIATAMISARNSGLVGTLYAREVK